MGVDLERTQIAGQRKRKSREDGIVFTLNPLLAPATSI